MKPFGIKEQTVMRKAARRNFEIENEIPKFKGKAHSSTKEYKRSKHKKFNYEETENF